MKSPLDTNAVLYFLKGQSSEKSLAGREVCVSIVTEIELLGYPHISPDHESAIRRFLERVEIVGITDSIKSKAIELRRHSTLRMPDAIIVATAICLDAELISNDAALGNFPGLRASRMALASE